MYTVVYIHMYTYISAGLTDNSWCSFYQQYCAHAHSARRQYLIYSEADFKVFRPTGATHCTDGVKFGTEEGT